ncbi:MAG: hypothetical protein AAGH40_13550, partial [Verrucomicrobiota bacterium]
LSSAKVSPELHDWLHATNTCASNCGSDHHENREDLPEHICAVEIFALGADDFTSCDIPPRQLVTKEEFLLQLDRDLSGKTIRSQYARAPPIEGFVSV